MERVCGNERNELMHRRENTKKKDEGKNNEEKKGEILKTGRIGEKTVRR